MTIHAAQSLSFVHEHNAHSAPIYDLSDFTASIPFIDSDIHSFVSYDVDENH